MDLGLEGKVFVVTAASQGLGLATARQLVAEGARVLLVARREEALAKLADELGAETLAGDLADPTLPQRAVDRAVERLGKVDGAFVSVGGPPKGGVLEVSDEQWEQAFQSVFLSAVRMARATYAANPAAVTGFVLSTSVKAPLSGLGISNGLRPGLAMLVKELGDTVGPDGGRAFAVLPGLTATERMEYLFANSDDPAKERATSAASIPLRRLGEPEEFGRVAAFLLSDAASYVNGCVVPVDGGSTRAL